MLFLWICACSERSGLSRETGIVNVLWISTRTSPFTYFWKGLPMTQYLPFSLLQRRWEALQGDACTVISFNSFWIEVFVLWGKCSQLFNHHCSPYFGDCNRLIELMDHTCYILNLYYFNFLHVDSVLLWWFHFSRIGFAAISLSTFVYVHELTLPT